MKNSYLIPKSETKVEQEIKRSRFITYIKDVESSISAIEYIKSIKELHPKARHHCHAFIAGEPNNTTECGMSDDGEPSGTAGKPMLSILQHSNIGNIVAVVVRYSSGIKLGTGGLVRAYSSSVQNGIDELETVELVPRTQVSMTFSYNHEEPVRNYLQENNVINITASYKDKVTFTCDAPATKVDSLKKAVLELLNGKVYF